VLFAAGALLDSEGFKHVARIMFKNHRVLMICKHVFAQQ